VRASCRVNARPITIHWIAGSPFGAVSRRSANEPKPERRRKAFRHKPRQRRADRPEEGGGVRRKVRVEASVPNVEVERRGRWLQGSLTGMLG
jgi:hypothetical protein